MIIPSGENPPEILNAGIEVSIFSLKMHLNHFWTLFF